MNWRWYIAVFVIVLAFFGVSSQQSALGPNQEIVVRFNTNSINVDEAKSTISSITSQLKAIGVEDVQVSAILDGTFKISYYSRIEVTAIKELLQKQEKLQHANADFNEKNKNGNLPLGDDSYIHYKLEVIKIQTDSGSDIGFNGVLIEVKSTKDQYVKPKLSIATSETNFRLKCFVKSVGSQTYLKPAIVMAGSAPKIPEVRAGPVA